MTTFLVCGGFFLFVAVMYLYSRYVRAKERREYARWWENYRKREYNQYVKLNTKLSETGVYERLDELEETEPALAFLAKDVIDYFDRQVRKQQIKSMKLPMWDDPAWDRIREANSQR